MRGVVGSSRVFYFTSFLIHTHTPCRVLAIYEMSTLPLWMPSMHQTTLSGTQYTMVLKCHIAGPSLRYEVGTKRQRSLNHSVW